MNNKEDALNRNEIILAVNGLGFDRDMGQFMIYLDKYEQESAPLQQLLRKLRDTSQRDYK